MVVNTSFGFGGSKPPLRPTNRHVAPAGSGVTVVNLSGEALRKRSEIADLRRKNAELGANLNSAMEALSVANAEIDRLKALTEVIKAMEASEKATKAENQSLKSENESLKADVEALSAVNEKLQARIDKDEKSSKSKKKQDQKPDAGSATTEGGLLS